MVESEVARTSPFNLLLGAPYGARMLVVGRGHASPCTMFVVTGDSSFNVSVCFEYCVNGVFIAKLMCGSQSPSMLKSPRTGGIRKQISPF